MAELLLGPIVGGLTDTQAYLWGRAGAPVLQRDSALVLHAWLGQQPDLSDAWLAGRSYPLSADYGWAGVAPVNGLQPETRYYYTLSCSDLPPEPGQGAYPAFTTFPRDGARRSFAFAFGSCFRPESEQGGTIFDQLDAYRQAAAADPKSALRFLLLIGDQIYGDDRQYNGIGKVAVSLEDYRQVYAYTWSRPPFQNLLRHLPAFMTLDDHEVDDDWVWTDFDRQTGRIPFWNSLKRRWQGCSQAECRLDKARIQAALQVYWEHQGMHAREYVNLLEVSRDGSYALEAGDQGSLAYTFQYGAAAFFVLDTRSMRVKKNQRERSMLGEAQWQALENWLLAVKTDYPVKFIISSASVIFRMWADIPRDRWTGFPRERQRLLQFLADHEIEGVYILAGDLHAGHAIRAELKAPGNRLIPIWEFCSTPFEQEPNWLARATYLPIWGVPLQNQQLLFICAEHNYGVIQVDFDGAAPQVSFNLQRSGHRPDLTVTA